MGGNLLKTFNLPEKRIPRSEYEILCKTLLDFFSSVIIGDFKIGIAPHVRNKADFGDIDLIIGSDELKLKDNNLQYSLKDFIEKIFKYTPHINDKTFSFPYCDFQVDIKVVDLKSFDGHFAYSSWGDCSNLMGTIFKRLNLSLTHKGLVKRVHRENVVLLTNYLDICNYGGFDGEKWKAGFESQEEVFQFIYNSEFFDSKIFQLKELNSENRSRNSKRTMYMNFLDFISKMPYKEFQFKTVSEYEEEQTKQFAALKMAKERLQEELSLSKIEKSRFNGFLAQEWTGLRGKKLGDLIKKFNSLYDVRLMSDEQVKTEFLKLYGNK